MKKLTFDQVKKIVGVHKSRNTTYIELYKKFFMWVMDRQIEIDRDEDRSWMANLTSPITYLLCMAVYGMYQDSKVAFEVYRVIKKAKGESIDDEESKKINEVSYAIIDLFENIYKDSDGSDEFDKSVLDAIILGNGFGGIGYEKSEDTYEVIGKDGKIVTIEEKISRPNIYRIIPLNIFTEASANSLDKSKVTIVRKIMTKGRINSMISVYGKEFNVKDERDRTKDIIEKKDWNMVFRYMIFNNMPGVTTLKNLGLKNTGLGGTWGGGRQLHTDIFEDNSFEIGQDLHEVYEVHTDKTFQIFVDGEDLGVFERIGPWKKKPFYSLAFRDGLNGLYDIGVGSISYSYHKVVDSFLNMRIDNNRLLASQPMLVNADETAFEGKDVLSRHPGKVLKVKDINESVRSMQLQSTGAGVAQAEVETLASVVQEAVGVPGYKMGIQQKVERSAKGVQELVESADAAMKSFIDSIAKAKSFISKYVVLLALEYMDKESIGEMSGMMNLKDEVDLTDLINNYTFNFDIESVSTLRERQEVDALKDFLRDFQGATRPDGTPLVSMDAGIKELIEKKRLNPDLYMSEEEAKEYMEQQIQSNADLQGQEMATPAAMLGGEGVMQEPEVQEGGPMGMAPESGIQGGSAGVGMATETNPLGVNQEQGAI